MFQSQKVWMENKCSSFFPCFCLKTRQQVTRMSEELMEGWSLQITCKIAKRVQTINIVIWQKDILLQVNECRPECNCQIYKEANWQTHTEGEITNPYMRVGRAEQPGGDDETQTKTLTHRRAPVTTEALLKVSDICLLVLLFFFLDASNCSMGENRKSSLKRRGWICAFFISQTISPDRQSHFFFLFFIGILSLLFSLLLFFSSLLKMIPPTSLQSTGKTLMPHTKKKNQHTVCVPLSSVYKFFFFFPEPQKLFATLQQSLFFCLPHLTCKETEWKTRDI